MDEAYVERVLRRVERIPAGRVRTYGGIADEVGSGPRRVARVMSTYGASVPWWRVVTAQGRLPPGLEVQARQHLVAEGATLRGERVDLAVSGWEPPPGDDAAASLGDARG